MFLTDDCPDRVESTYDNARKTPKTDTRNESGHSAKTTDTVGVIYTSGHVSGHSRDDNEKSSIMTNTSGH
jgi:hypothetical protein